MERFAYETMSKDLIITHQDQSLDEAYKVMQANHIRHLPVINSEKVLVGMLSDRDLQRAMTSEISGDGKHRSESCHFNPQLRVKDYMVWPVKCVDKKAFLQKVAEEMVCEKVSALLVKDSAQIAGIITREDLLKVLMSLLQEPRPRRRAPFLHLLEDIENQEAQIA